MIQQPTSIAGDVIHGPAGPVSVLVATQGVTEVRLGHAIEPFGETALLRRVVQALRDGLHGRPQAYAFPLALPNATPFNLAVWRAAQAIPWGEARTYGELAHSIGRPGAARAVGSALGRNPVPILVPCHRIVGANGLGGGFTGGMEWKRFLLQCEGYDLDGNIAQTPIVWSQAQ